jgi:prevent-host-death family protein
MMLVKKENRMNQETISIAEAKRTFSGLLGKVAYGGKRVVITKRGKPMALLSPSEESRFYHLSMQRLGQ